MRSVRSLQEVVEDVKDDDDELKVVVLLPSIISSSLISDHDTMRVFMERWRYL